MFLKDRYYKLSSSLHAGQLDALLAEAGLLEVVQHDEKPRQTVVAQLLKGLDQDSTDGFSGQLVDGGGLLDEQAVPDYFCGFGVPKTLPHSVT